MNNRILLISDRHHFSTRDVYDGYVAAFQHLGINFDVVPIHEMVDEGKISHYSLDGAHALALAKLLNKDNEFTHCVCISGMLLPDWFIKSMYDKKLIVIATDDPHASKLLEDKAKYIDYWCTNCKNMEGDKKFYLPVATSSILPSISKSEVPDKFKSDVVFVGTVYKDREEPLERICKYCEYNNLKVKIVGPLLRTKKDSIIRKYAVEGIVKNVETKLLYRGANVVINIDRNIFWNPMEDDGNSLLTDVGEPYSNNPRVYEIAGCRSTQLFVNPRQEAKDIFGDNIYYSNYDNVVEVLDKIFKEDKNIILEKINNCFNIVTKDHTYINRAKQLLKIIEEN